jgi:hypothetical protein
MMETNVVALPHLEFSKPVVSMAVAFAYLSAVVMDAVANDDEAFVSARIPCLAAFAWPGRREAYERDCGVA